MRTRKAFVLLTAAALAAFTFISCSKSDKKDDEPNQEEAGKIPGLGDTGGQPQGTALTLPAGVSFTTAVFKGEVCDTAYEVGSGGLVEICVGIVNTNAADVTITLPAGLIAISESTEYQHGFLIQNATVVLKAKRTTQVGVNMFCVNMSRLPSSGTAKYKIGPVSSSTLLRELIDMLKNKRTARSEYTDFDLYFSAVNSIQTWIWAITDGEGLDKSNMAAQLAAIPNK